MNDDASSPSALVDLDRCDRCGLWLVGVTRGRHGPRRRFCEVIQERNRLLEEGWWPLAESWTVAGEEEAACWDERRTGPGFAYLVGGFGPEDVLFHPDPWVRMHDDPVAASARAGAMAVLHALRPKRKLAGMAADVLAADEAAIRRLLRPEHFELRALCEGGDHRIRFERGRPVPLDHGEGAAAAPDPPTEPKPRRSVDPTGMKVPWTGQPSGPCDSMVWQWADGDWGHVMLDLIGGTPPFFERSVIPDPGVAQTAGVMAAACRARLVPWLHRGARPSPVLMLEVSATGAHRRVACGLDRLGSTLHVQVPPSWAWDVEPGEESRSLGF